MYWRKRDLLKAAAVVGGVLFLVLMALVTVTVADARSGVSGAYSAGMVTVQATPTEDATVTALNKEKLQLDVDQEKHTLANWLWSGGGALLSAYIAAIVGLMTVFRQLGDRRDEREKQQEQQTEERFKSVVEGLGSTNPATQVGFAIMLRSFLNPSYKRFHKQVFALVVANLRLRNHDPNKPEPLDSLSQELIIVFKESFLLSRDKLSEQDYRLLDHIQLDSAYLAQADLKSIRMRKASLREADLSGADLSNADFSNADLRGANLEDANVKGVDLHGVTGLKKEQLEACRAKGAIVDEATMARASRSPSSPSPSPQQPS